EWKNLSYSVIGKVMVFENLSIKTKVIAVIMLTSMIVLLLTAAAFMAYDLFTYRQTVIQHVKVSSAIVAAEGAVAISFTDPDYGREMLSSLGGDSHFVSAALYDDKDHLFAWYPTNRPSAGFPQQ